jgi:DNA-binding beta-propeller fold protein YncE
MTNKLINLRSVVCLALFVSGIASLQACRRSFLDAGADQPEANQAASLNARVSLAVSTAAPLRVISLAGSSAGFMNGSGTTAKFSSPGSLVVDAAGNIYVADRDNNMIRKISTDGNVSVFAGKTTPGLDNGKGEAASFRKPTGIAIDANGTLYVADSGNNQVRKIVPAADGKGEVTLLAGSPTGDAGFTDETPAASAQFNGPTGIAVDASGANVYVTDAVNVRIRKISGGFVNTLAGNGQTGNNPDPSPIPGRVASFNAPAGLAVDTVGNIYLADKGNNRIRKISATGIVTPFTGNANGSAGNTDGSLTEATFNAPAGITIGADGTMLIADMSNNRIRKIVLSAGGAGMVSTLAGSGAANFIDGAPGAAAFNAPAGVAVTIEGEVYIADQNNHRIREIGSSAMVTTFIGTGVPGSQDGEETGVQVMAPVSIVSEPIQILNYMMLVDGDRVRQVFMDGHTITRGGGFPGWVDGPTPTARFNGPTGVGIDGNNIQRIYIADRLNHRIRRVTPGPILPIGQPWQITTVAGSGPTGPAGGGFADGHVTGARFNNPTSLVFDAAHSMYVTDWGNHCIRKIFPTSFVSIFAGNLTPDKTDGTGLGARFNHPWGIAKDAADFLYVTDEGNHMVRKISPAGVVTTLAGNGTPGNEDAQGAAARFNSPRGIALDAAGNVYVADYGNNRIRKITPDGTVTTVAGTRAGFLNGPGSIARFSGPTGITVKPSGEILVTDAGNFRVRKIVQ